MANARPSSEGRPVRMTYDAEVDILYIHFREATVTTKELGEGIAEVLNALTRLGDRETFRSITLEDIALARGA